MRINLIILSVLLLTGCFRGSKFENTPIHLNPNMDNQQKYRSLEESNFFEDGSTMRKPIEGTVARELERKLSNKFHVILEVIKEINMLINHINKFNYIQLWFIKQ